MTTPATVAPELLPLTKNPVVTLLDRRDLPAAKSYPAHLEVANREAQEQPISSLFSLVQRSSKGFWVSEWSVVVRDGKRAAHRRRVARGKTLEAAVDSMLRHPSSSRAHNYFAEEGVRGFLKRVLA